MKLLIYLFSTAFILVGSCSQTKHSVKIETLKNKITIQDSALVVKYENTIVYDELNKKIL